MKKGFFLFLMCLVSVNGFFLAEEKSKDFPILTGPYLGQKPPGNIPEVFAPGIISTGLNELNAVFSKNRMEFYFCVRNSFAATVFSYTCRHNQWSGPKPLPFASRFGEIDVSLSPDGGTLFFCTRRPAEPGSQPKKDHDIWQSKRTGNTWEEPVRLGDEVNSASEDFYPVLTHSGTLYFNSQREGEGTNNIYMSESVDGKYKPAEKLGPEINSRYREFDAFVTPDETFIIFASNRPGGLGLGDLYISFKTKGGNWTPAQNMGEPVNSPGFEFCPMLSPCGKYLFFTSGRRVKRDLPEASFSYKDYLNHHNGPHNTSTNIYWVDAGIIYNLRQKVLK